MESLKQQKPTQNNFALAPNFVGVAGFEPTTSSSRTTHATKLRYTPMIIHKISK
jgi:hypothetical protein